jgi:predicted helicase
MPNTVDLRAIRSFEDLIRYLEDQLDWPLQEYGFEELTFEYSPEELGIKASDAAKISQIHQLRPLYSGQPWGIFFVEFESKKLPVVVLRRILSHLVVKKRASANKSTSAAWDTQDLLFISAFGEENSDQREIAFAHFHQEPGDLPSLRVLGWDGADTPLKLNHLDKVLHDHLRWPDKPNDQTTWRNQWQQPFRHRIGHIIRTADALAEVLAQLARNIRDRAKAMLAAEAENGPLRTLHKAFQTSLIHDLTEESFADTYAQTITYGLLTAAISRTDRSEGRYGTALIAENITEMVPVTNPFLKEMLQTFLKAGGRKGGIDFDELGIQDVVELLRGDETDLNLILLDFGNRSRGEDPVIHFYEHFLTAYNKKLKVQRGVFYTPQPAVSYIVRSVHELLQTEFGLAEGLASTNTWAEMKRVNPAIQIPEDTDPDSPFVVILDPATGTATFLVEVIDLIFRTLNEKWSKQGFNERQRETAWNDYVPKHLLPRLYGYELMMAPYAIAHMKIGLKLFETGYRFGSDERARVFLTNALEPASDDKKQMELDEVIPALAHEAKAVNEVKIKQKFTILIGNPPYSLYSANLTEAGNKLISPFRFIGSEAIRERGALQLEKNLQDDYIKFLGLALKTLDNSQFGILGFICNHGYLNNRTLRGLRHSFINFFNRAILLELHGSVSRSSTESREALDQNIFEIQQGVAIGLFCKTKNKADLESMLFEEIYGSRQIKYDWLTENNLSSANWQKLNPRKPLFLFEPSDSVTQYEYERGISLEKIFPLNSTGIVSARDSLTVQFLREDVERIAHDIDYLPVEQIRSNYNLGDDTKDWAVYRAKEDIHNGLKNKENPTPILYRPFDIRWTFYTGKARGFMCNPRKPVMGHIYKGKNIALCCNRQVNSDFQHVGVTKWLVTDCTLSTATRERTYVFPLYVYHEDNILLKDESPHINLSPEVFSILTKITSGSTDIAGDSLDITPEKIFHYIYAILHSPIYRNRYRDFLKSDFPYIPFTDSLALFIKLTLLGEKLISLHLLESSVTNQFISKYQGVGDNSIPKKPSYKEGAVWINAFQRFENVPEAVWKFHIGGYQVCEKWLKDRKGRVLSEEDIVHYQKIIVALHETILLMEEIDAVIDEHGSWPDAFHTDSSQESA